jgi:signal transduction histidine kinase
VQSLLDYARPPAPQRRVIDLREAVRQALRLIHTRLAQQGVELTTSLPSESVRYPVDADQLAGVLGNLFLNALDAMPQGGRLTVALEPTSEGISLSVCDTGAGVPSSMQDRLFVPFVSSKPTGTGLGLHSARRVVEQHGGRLLARNQPEGGACFRIELPAVHERGCVSAPSGSGVA